MADTLTPIFPEVIDSTIRSDYVSCGHKAELSRILGLSPKGGSVHLIAGGAFAAGCEITRKEFYGNGKTEDEAITLGVMAALKHYGNFDEGERFKHKSANRVAFALAEYFTEYPLARDKVQPYRKADGTPAIEFEFSFPLETLHPDTGNPLLYGGRFDMVGEFMSSLWVLDEKTATRLGPSWLNSFTLRGQLIGYCYAAQQFDLPINGFIVRGISFLKDYYGHAEVIQPVPQHRIDTWREQVEIDAYKMVQDYKRGHFDKAFGDACNSYGGCPFLKLCDKQDYRDWWEQYFDVEYWHPLSKQKAHEDAQILAS